MPRRLILEWSLSITSLVLSSYILLSSLLYNHKKRTTSQILRTANRLCCVTAAMVWLATLPVNFELLLIPLNFDPCMWTFRLGVGFYVLHKCAVYATIWFRQHSVFQIMQTRRTELISRAKTTGKLVLVGIVLTGSVNLLSIGFIKVWATENGCRYEPLYPAVIYANVILSILCRVALVTIFVVALRICYSEISGMVSMCVRLLVCATCCVLTELLFLPVIEFLPKADEAHPLVTYYLVACAMTLNGLCLNVALICSFSDYVDRLFPFRLKTLMAVVPGQEIEVHGGNVMVPVVFINSVTRVPLSVRIATSDLEPLVHML